MRAAALVCLLAGVAHADATGPESKASPPDRGAEEQAREANLVSNAPRSGVTFSGSFGGGMVFGDGVGRGAAGSLRLGHVATPQTVLTLEVTVGTLLHAPEGGTTHINNDVGLLAGGLYYTSPSLWIRGAGGLTVYAVDDVVTGKAAHPGVGGLFGIGLDLARWHYLVLGLETFSMVSIVGSKGLMMTSGLCFGLSYY